MKKENNINHNYKFSAINSIKNYWISFNQKDSKTKLFTSLWSIFIGLLISSIIILFLGINPIEFFSTFIKSSIERPNDFWAILSIYIIIGLAVGLGFKSGIFNIGVSGQMMIGGIVSLYFLSSNHVTTGNILLTLLFSIILGAMAAGIAGILKTFFNVHEVVTTIMMNWIIFYIGKNTYNSQGKYINESGTGSLTLILPEEFSLHSFMPFIIITALVLVVVISIILNKTTIGYKTKMTGLNPDAAVYAGTNKKLSTIITLTVSGALAGLAGWFYYVLYLKTYTVEGAPLELGFDSIAISLIAFNSPFGIIFSSGIFSVLKTGILVVTSQFNVKAEFIQIIIGVIIYLSAISVIFTKFNLIKYTRNAIGLLKEPKFFKEYIKYVKTKYKYRILILKYKIKLIVNKKQIQNNNFHFNDYKSKHYLLKSDFIDKKQTILKQYNNFWLSKKNKKEVI